MTDELLRNRDDNDRYISATTGLAIEDPFEQDRHDRGRPFTDEEIAAWVSDRRYAYNNKRVAVVTEIAVQLWDEKHELEIIHTGSFQERLEAMEAELEAQDGTPFGFAAAHVSLALMYLRATPVTPEGGEL